MGCIPTGALAIDLALGHCIGMMNRPDSPVRKLRRINEASKYFEDLILQQINATPGLQCGIPPTRAGTHQRSGYPDLRITDAESGIVFYLDPKLVEKNSDDSTLRTFYFEPKDETLKITDEASIISEGMIFRHGTPEELAGDPEVRRVYLGDAFSLA